MTSTEFLLLAALFAAVGYILWQEKQPKTDAEREAEAMRRVRMEAAKEAQRRKMENARRDTEGGS